MELCMICSLVLLVTAFYSGTTLADNVTYDGRSLIINGKHRLLFSGSIHYPRSTPQMWPSLIAKAKEGGLDAIQTYVFWNLHEPQQGQYDFSGRKDLVRFIKEAQAQGLYVCLRIGPFIESEWNYGGLPFWLHDIPGIIYRSDNEPFKFHMKDFTSKIVNMMKAEKLYASQGGPIILSQIENEYNIVEAAFHESGTSYVRWAAEMAVGLETGVPWIMCKQQDAPDPVINTCNGMQCGKTFPGPNSPNKPSMWTELWTSFVQQYGEKSYIRTVEEIAFHAALFILAKNGSYVNYYMYHGGTNFGRTSSAYVITSYYDLAPLDEFGSIRQPKWGHLKELHTVMKLCSQPLLYGERATSSLGPLKDAYVYQDKSSGKCAAFLVNNDNREAKVWFRNSTYRLPKESISILPDCKNIAFNTAKVNTQYDTRSMVPTQNFNSSGQWQSFKEPVLNYETAMLRDNSILEHTSTTKDKSDYLWYTLRFNHDVPNDTALLSVFSHGHILHAYVNGVLVGSAPGYSKSKTFTLEANVTLNKGINDISLLSVVVGLPDGGAYMERRVLGVRRVWIQDKEFTISPWGYQVGLLGENLQIYSDIGSSLENWSYLESSNSQPLTWYKTQFDELAGEKPIALNLGTMGKGEAFVNGQSIGRYWASFLTPTGTPSQTWYHVPRTFLKPRGNLLVIQEEEGGNPLGISIDTVSISKVCAQVSESHLPPLSSWVRMDQTRERIRNTHHYSANVQLYCPRGKKISNILFASYGNPSGNCANYTLGSCHSFQSATVVEQACLGKRWCTVPVSNKMFGDPCPRVLKQLLVDAKCN